MQQQERRKIKGNGPNDKGQVTKRKPINIPDIEQALKEVQAMKKPEKYVLQCECGNPTCRSHLQPGSGWGAVRVRIE